MTAGAAHDAVLQRIEAVYRSESRRVLATLIRLLGDFDLAEEAMHDAFGAAVEQWARDGVPSNPRAWLVSTGRFRAIDTIRKRARSDASLAQLAMQLDAAAEPMPLDDASVPDDRLRLIFTCCHPALPPDAQVALTLREVCGLSTEEVAHAFLTRPSAIAQRIVRAKSKIRDARIPYVVPEREQLRDRLEIVLHVIYLVFNEGYSASSGEALTRTDLSAEAIRLGRLLVELLPDGEALGLLALMLFHEARHATRTGEDGEIVLLDQQNRSRWDASLIADGGRMIERALATKSIGPFTLQAAIAAVHMRAATPADTDWNEIVVLYDLLLRLDPSPIVELNRAAAIAMRDGPKQGIALIDALFERGELRDYHLAHSARADLLRRVGEHGEALISYERALDLVQQGAARRFLEGRIAELRA